MPRQFPHCLPGYHIISILNFDHVSSFYQSAIYLSDSYHVKAIPSGFWKPSIVSLYSVCLYFSIFCQDALDCLGLSLLRSYILYKFRAHISFWGYTHRCKHHVQFHILCNPPDAPMISLISKFLTHLLLSHFNFLKLLAIFYT